MSPVKEAKYQLFSTINQQKDTFQQGKATLLDSCNAENASQDKHLKITMHEDRTSDSLCNFQAFVQESHALWCWCNLSTWASSELLRHMRTRIHYLKADNTLGVQKVTERITSFCGYNVIMAYLRWTDFKQQTVGSPTWSSTFCMHAKCYRPCIFVLQFTTINTTDKPTETFQYVSQVFATGSEMDCLGSAQGLDSSKYSG